MRQIDAPNVLLTCESNHVSLSESNHVSLSDIWVNPHVRYGTCTSLTRYLFYVMYGPRERYGRLCITRRRWRERLGSLSATSDLVLPFLFLPSKIYGEKKKKNFFIFKFMFLVLNCLSQQLAPWTSSYKPMFFFSSILWFVSPWFSRSRFTV